MTAARPQNSGIPQKRQTVFAAIDFKSFYASVECVARGLDPLTANLVVADESRTDKTICLAVSPSLKQYGLSGRSRLFEVRQKAREIRQKTGRDLEYIVAPPRMQLYMDTSTGIYRNVYLQFFSPEDIHVYSIDEVMIDLTRYLPLYQLRAADLVRRVIGRILSESGITATAGIGTNLYLAKIAMDILAKHAEADENGARIAALNEKRYRELLWDHQPLEDFWRVGHGIAARLRRLGCDTMGDVALLSLRNEDALYREFGIDAELLIDHAWGVEPCTMADIKAYRPESSSISSGQVLPEAYDFSHGKLIVREMADQLALELVQKDLVTDCVDLTVIYDRPGEDTAWRGEEELDRYGRKMPRHAHGSRRVTDSGGAEQATSSAKKLADTAERIYTETVDPSLPVRRFYLAYLHTMPRSDRRDTRQMDFFADEDALRREREREAREDRLQRAALAIRGKFGGNALLKGMNLLEGATGRDRNRQIGGHAAGNPPEKASAPVPDRKDAEESHGKI